MSEQFYILSLKHSPRNGAAVWWRPGAAGYTTDLAQAGVYSLAEVEADPGYYNNGETTAAWYKEAVEALAGADVATVAWLEVDPRNWPWEKGVPPVLGYRQPAAAAKGETP